MSSYTKPSDCGIICAAGAATAGSSGSTDSDFGQRILERQKFNSDKQPYCEVGTRPVDPDISSWFAGIAGGGPGQVLVGLNR